MRQSAQTTMGGEQDRFVTTRWSQVQAASGHDAARRNAVINSLIRAYWKPVYCYLRRKGYDNEQAKDLTQGFFHEIVLSRDLIRRADKSKGRFRTFLLTALDHYVTSTYRKQTAAKRSPQTPMFAIDEFDEDALTTAAKQMRPDELFIYVWASQLLEDVLADVEDRCRQDDKTTHWRLFQARVLDPIVTGRAARPLRELCRQFDVTDEVKAENMIVTVKRRFQKALKATVSQYVESDADVEGEIRELIEILSR